MNKCREIAAAQVARLACLSCQLALTHPVGGRRGGRRRSAADHHTLLKMF